MDSELQKSLDDTFKEWQMMELDHKNHIIEQKDKFNELVIRHNILFNYYFIMVLIGFSILKNK